MGAGLIAGEQPPEVGPALVEDHHFAVQDDPSRQLGQAGEFGVLCGSLGPMAVDQTVARAGSPSTRR